MKKVILTFGFMLFAFSIMAQKKEQWISLFDGKSTQGWHTYGKPTASDLAWKVQDGTLYLDASQKTGRGDIVTAEEFENFHLKLEWKISKNGNSGIMFHVHEDTAIYKYTFHTGPEMQVLDNEGHPDAKINKHRAGDLYDLIACSKETVKPAGEWNTAEIICNKGKLELLLNGTTVVATTLWTDEWKQLVANSKFKTMPGFGIFKSGRIALQDHGNEVWYRNIVIKKL
ncbi:MAG: DUF1080 domain-containing protein [Sphingobacteriia bacterium]|nr:DUF1080 domain-containing protein [Sphingobacteriia bacterium]